MNGLQLKKALLTSALAVLRCPMTPAEKDQALSNAIALLSDDDHCLDDLQHHYPTVGLPSYDLAIANYFEGTTQSVQ